MASSNNPATQIVDPCAEIGPNQRWAFVWFVAILIIGTVATVKFAGMDKWMWEHNADWMDWDKYKENRVAHTTIPSERNDRGSEGDYASAATDPTPTK